MKKIILVLVSVLLIITTVLPASASDVAFTPVETDGMVFTPKNYVEKGVKCDYFIGVPIKAAGGYNYSPLFAYLLNPLENQESMFDYIDDFTGWESYGNEKPVPNKNSGDTSSKYGNGNMEMRLERTANNSIFEGKRYMGAYEVDLGDVNKIGGYIMHFSWRDNDGGNFKDNYDYDFFVSADGTTWNKITSTSGTMKNTIDYSIKSLDAEGVSKFLNKECENVEVQGTYSVVEAGDVDERGNGNARRHPVLDVKFDKAIEARYIRVCFKTARTEGSTKQVFCYGLEVYKAAENAPVELDLSPVVETEAAGEETTAPETTETVKPETTQSTDTAAPSKGGCSGALTVSMIAPVSIMFAFGLAVRAKSKNKK